MNKDKTRQNILKFIGIFLLICIVFFSIYFYNIIKHKNKDIIKYNDFIDVLPAPKDPRHASKISSKYINVVLSRMSFKYDIILIDTNHVIDEINLVTMDASDEILFVVTNDPIDLKNMRSMISIFKDMDKSNYKIILNESVDRLRNYFTKYDIKNIIKDNIDYTILVNSI